MNIHNVFHISLLKPAPLGAPLALQTEIQLVNLSAKYKVKELLDCQFIRNKLKYLVKWLGYPHLENT